MKRRVMLVHPPLTFEERYGESAKFTGHIHPPQGLCHLAAMLDPAEFDVAILDAQALFMGIDDTAKAIVEYRPDVVGVMTFTVSMHNSAELMDRVRSVLHDVPFVFGGPHMTALPEETFRRFPRVELGVVGEGEETFVELLQAIFDKGDLSKIAGLVWRDQDGGVHRNSPRAYMKSLDQLPRPAWELLPHLPDTCRPSSMTYRALPAVAIVTSRGCPFHCAFCDNSVFGRKWRANSPEKVLEWIDHLVETYGIKDINLQDDHFMVDKKRLAKFCQLIKERHPTLMWSAIGRADSVDANSVRLMKEAGCWQIAFGLESGSQRILDVLHKDETVEEMEMAVRLTKEAGMTVKGLFMAGCPTEDEESLRQTQEFIERLDVDYISMSAFTPLPNTEVFRRSDEFGRWEGAGPEDWHKMNLWEPIWIPHGLTKERIKEFVRRAPAKKLQAA